MSFGLRHTLLDREGWRHQRRNLSRAFGLRPAAIPQAAPARRFATAWTTALLVPGQPPLSVVIIDLSETGARLNLAASLPVGMLLRLVLPSRRTKHARLVWCDDGEAGLEFLSPLSQHAVEIEIEDSHAT